MPRKRKSSQRKRRTPKIEMTKNTGGGGGDGGSGGGRGGEGGEGKGTTGCVDRIGGGGGGGEGKDTTDCVDRIGGGAGGGEGKDTTDCVDRISNLPIDIIRQIHFCLPRRDAIRTSVLSPRWRTICASHPKIYLDERDFGANFFVHSNRGEVEFGAEYCERDIEKRNAFLNYLEKSLDIRHKYCDQVDTLFLQMKVENASAASLVKKWIDFAFANKVKMLHVSLKTIYGKRFQLSNVAFVSATLVELNIEHCHISNCSFMLPALRSLFVVNVCIEDDDFKDLLVGCPRIEHLRIFFYSKTLPTMVVSSPTLKHFSLHFPSFNGKVLMESKNLESLEFSCFLKYMWEIELTSRARVRILKLRGVNDLSRTLMHEFPLLEKLKISGCKNLQNLYVSQRNLARFVLRHCVDEVAVRIDAPKLKSFDYTGGLTSFPGIEASKELECVRFYLIPEMLNARWYIWLRNILESFAHSKHLSLICASEQAVIFPDELTEMLLPTINDLKNLELRIDSSAASAQQILDGFAWILPGLKTFSLTLGSITKFIEFPQSG